MKTIFTFALLTLALFSCKKNTETTSSLEQKIYFYRLSVIDVDSSMTQTPVRVAKTDQIVEVVGSVNDDGNETVDCTKRPNHTKCKSLPIHMEYFEVYEENQTVVIEWKTSLEDNVARFEVQRSEDGLNFYTSKIVSPKGPSVYKVKDK
jgi:uncharacterized protein (DUF488 family)